MSLCREGLSVYIALQSVRAAEVVAQEAKAMQEPPLEPTNPEINQVGGSDKSVYYRCGYKGHLVSACRYKNAKCQFCLKVGHLAKVYCNPCQKTTKASKLKSKHRYELGRG